MIKENDMSDSSYNTEKSLLNLNKTQEQVELRSVAKYLFYTKYLP